VRRASSNVPMRRVVLVLLLLLNGCAVRQPSAIVAVLPPTTRPAAVAPAAETRTADWVIWNAPGQAPWRAYHATAWLAEARTRWPDPFIICCHGLGVADLWVFARENADGTPQFVLVDDAVRGELERLPAARDVILVTCNTDGFELTGMDARVKYSRRSVWQSPGPETRWMTKPGAERWASFTGDIDEFMPAFRPPPTTRRAW
jgi:hypothetical protein